MKRTILAVALAALSTAALATGGAGSNDSANAAATAGASATGVGISANHNSVTGYTSGYAVGNANSAYGVGGNATALSGQGGTGVALSAPSQGVTVQGDAAPPAYQTITHNGSQTLKNVPSTFAPNIYPTSPCMGSSSAAGMWAGFGFSGGTSWTDEECQKQEAARNAPTAADRIFVWCQSKYAVGSPSCAGVIAPIDSKGAVTGSLPVTDARREVVATTQDEPRQTPGYVW